MLGPTLGTRLPSSVDVPAHLGMAHARILDRLRHVYGNGNGGTLPVFAGDGLEVIRWAEAKLAASSILSTLLVSLPEASREAVVQLRAEAFGDLDGGVPGYAPGATPVDPDGVPSDDGTRPSYAPSADLAAGSLWPSPYDADVFELGASTRPIVSRRWTV